MLKSILKNRSLKRFASPPEKTRVQTSEAEPWHVLPAPEICQKLQTNPETGLSEEQVSTRQEEYGSNALPGKKPPSLFSVVLDQFKNPLIYILIIAALIAILVGDAKDSIFIIAVIMLNTIVGTTQEWKAEKSALALQNLLQDYTTVRRNGDEHEIPFEELVPGDIVLLESGSRVPADIRLLEANNLTADEALLTGESVPVEKRTEPISDPDLPVSELGNMVFAGSFITTGRALGVVTSTGIRTEVGKIAESVMTTGVTKTPLLIRMESFTRRIGYVVLGSTATLGVIAFIRGMPMMDSFLFAVALAVSAVPEGLPIAMTVALSIATKRMADRKVIVRQLAAVEGLGSCTYIVTDKTGTLTINKQIVKLVALANGERFKASAGAYTGEGEVKSESGDLPNPEEKGRIEPLAKAGVICNEGRLAFNRMSNQWEHHGDAVDVAILAFAYKLGLEIESIRKQTQKVGEIPYESERRYAATFYRKDGTTRVAVKGALETVLPFCRFIRVEQELEAIDPQAIETMASALAEEGYRVLAVAEGELHTQKEGSFGEEDLVDLALVGFFCMLDPLRPEAKPAVEKCQQAGIKVSMVTGDHPATALTIARELGIAESWEGILNGRQLQEVCSLNREECDKATSSIRVFARVTPLQKLDIVTTLMDLGDFVAVTGDGVNDAPALRKANIGIAMGSGSDITKDISSIIIADDNFATIQAGVEEGRFAYGNIRKVVWFLISNGAAEVTLFLLSLLLGLPLPLLPVQILWANLVTSGIQDIGLAFEAGEPEVMQQPPRKPTESVFNRSMIYQTLISGGTMGLVCFGTWFWLMESGWEEASARNIVLLLLVLLENFHVFNARSEHKSAFRVPLRNNTFLILIVLVAQGLHLLAMNVPFLQNVLGLQPVTVQEWLTVFFLASSVLIVTEIFKWFKRQRIPADTILTGQKA